MRATLLPADEDDGRLVQQHPCIKITHHLVIRAHG